ncbi:hypothetical protein SLOPH_809 [Spraguea lophii 42_110]|uniref:Uncharacterized protein n=1 Tax=Spraguea lophii (strain 42_110) TaxID=1358809 RepID=S7XU05_SPRLO|nr:hypothetical protein SLOPH_809 [Spraguea lophii 42_110]
MAFSKITFNKILFVVIILVELAYTTIFFLKHLVLYHLDILLFILVLLSKYHLYLICYKTINRRNINYGILSLMLSFSYEILFFSMLFLKNIGLFMIMFYIVCPISLGMKLALLLSIYFFKTLLYFDISIPVEGYEISKRVDNLADNIPGL